MVVVATMRMLIMTMTTAPFTERLLWARLCT